MQSVIPNTQPMLLLVSRALPSPEGDAEQRRAWDALALAASNRRVCLVTLAPRRINLSQWRQLNDRVEHVELVPTGKFRLRRRWRRTIDDMMARYPIARVYRVDERGSECVSMGEATVFHLPTGGSGPLKRAA